MSLLVNRARIEGFVVFDYAHRYAEAATEIAGWLREGRLRSREDVVRGSVADFPDTLLRLFRGENTASWCCRSATERATGRWAVAGRAMGALPRRVPGDLLVHLRRARDHADLHYAETLDLEALAAVAGISKYHFQRLFTATYGVSPAAYLSQRRVERAQNLLRATNLTVTEVCHAVGFSSLGSFSSRFRELVGETPSEFQRRWAASGAPRIPGCFVFMWGLAERRSASEEKQAAPRGP